MFSAASFVGGGNGNYDIGVLDSCRDPGSAVRDPWSGIRIRCPGFVVRDAEPGTNIARRRIFFGKRIPDPGSRPEFMRLLCYIFGG